MTRSRQILVRWGLLAGVLLFWGVLGCVGTQQIRNFCENNKCPKCSSDKECVIVSNPCYKVGSCTHKKSNLAVTLLGCEVEYKVPSHDSCKCRAGVCRFEL